MVVGEFSGGLDRALYTVVVDEFSCGLALDNVVVGEITCGNDALLDTVVVGEFSGGLALDNVVVGEISCCDQGPSVAVAAAEKGKRERCARSGRHTR